MTSPPRGEGGGSPNGDITTYISLYSKKGDKGEGGVKNLKMEVMSFVNGPYVYLAAMLGFPNQLTYEYSEYQVQNQSKNYKMTGNFWDLRKLMVSLCTD